MLDRPRPTIRLPNREAVRLTGYVMIWPGLRSAPGDVLIRPDKAPRGIWIETRYGPERVPATMARRISRLAMHAEREWRANPYRWVTLRNDWWAGRLRA